VTNHGYDRDALTMMAHAAREVMSGDNIEAIAGKGYCKARKSLRAKKPVSGHRAQATYFQPQPPMAASIAPTSPTSPAIMPMSVLPAFGVPLHERRMFAKAASSKAQYN